MKLLSLTMKFLSMLIYTDPNLIGLLDCCMESDHYLKIFPKYVLYRISLVQAFFYLQQLLLFKTLFDLIKQFIDNNHFYCSQLLIHVSENRNYK